jgi:hypothetical protein
MICVLICVTVHRSLASRMRTRTCARPTASPPCPLKHGSMATSHRKYTSKVLYALTYRFFRLSESVCYRLTFIGLWWWSGVPDLRTRPFCVKSHSHESCSHPLLVCLYSRSYCRDTAASARLHHSRHPDEHIKTCHIVCEGHSDADGVKHSTRCDDVKQARRITNARRPPCAPQRRTAVWQGAFTSVWPPKVLLRYRHVANSLRRDLVR